MKPVLRYWAFLTILTFCTAAVIAQTTLPTPQAVLTKSEKKLVADFEKRARRYVDLRDKAKRGLPALSKDATPEQITAYKTAFQKAVQARRANAKVGELFTPAAAAFIRRRIKREFTTWERSELRKTVLEADNKGVPLKINYPYPESKELVEMSPELLLSLPQLPKHLRYRFIGRNLAILDRDNAIIVDFMKQALL